MDETPNVLNLPDDVYWDVYDVASGRKILRNAPRITVETTLRRHEGAVTLDPIGALRRRTHLEGRADKGAA